MGVDHERVCVGCTVLLNKVAKHFSYNQIIVCFRVALYRFCHFPMCLLLWKAEPCLKLIG